MFDCQTFNIVALQLQSSMSISPTCTAFSAVIWLHGAFNVPDCRIPRETRPRVTGDKRCKLTLPPPCFVENKKEFCGWKGFQLQETSEGFLFTCTFACDDEVQCQGWNDWCEKVKSESIKFKLTAFAHSPNKVIKFGSPPKARALSLSHRIASAWSHIPWLPVNSRRVN